MEGQCFGSEQRTCPNTEGGRCESGSFAATDSTRPRRLSNTHPYPHPNFNIDPYLHTFRYRDGHGYRNGDRITITYLHSLTNANLYPYTNIEPYAHPDRLTNTDKHLNRNTHLYPYPYPNINPNANTPPDQYTASAASFPDCFVSGWPE